jgi:hypothetical protein
MGCTGPLGMGAAEHRAGGMGGPWTDPQAILVSREAIPALCGLVGLRDTLYHWTPRTLPILCATPT